MPSQWVENEALAKYRWVRCVRDSILDGCNDVSYGGTDLSLAADIKLYT